MKRQSPERRRKRRESREGDRFKVNSDDTFIGSQDSISRKKLKRMDTKFVQKQTDRRWNGCRV